MKLFRNNKTKINKEKNGENIPHLEITEAVLIHCSIVNNDYQQDSRFLYNFFLINHLINYYIFFTQKFYIFKKFDTEFSYTEVWFTNSKPLEIEGKINIALVIK